MTAPESDRELLEATWRLYSEQFGDHVGEVVTPYDYVDTEDQVDWVARIFMFAYALGSVAGAHAANPEAIPAETDSRRVEAVVDDVIDIHDSAAFEVSNASIRDDFLR